MTFRRRLLVAALTLGGGICCFQPVMRSRMEARLSELVGGPVEIGSSKFSLRDSTIALGDIVIRPNAPGASSDSDKPLGPIKIGQALFKFNWNSVFYRNLKVESFIASDVRWEIAVPSPSSIPTANETADTSFLNETDNTSRHDARVNSLVQPIKLRLTEESAKQNRTQQKISMQLKSITERLTEVLPTEGSHNVLRQRFVVDDAKKEIAKVVQLIAEDRLARKDADKAVSLLKLSAQKQLASESLEGPKLDFKRARQAAIEIAKLTIAKEWNQSRPVVHAAISSLTSLQNPIKASFENVEMKGAIPSEIVLANLPVGLTSCFVGKINGQIQFPLDFNPSGDSTFVLQFWNLSSRNFLDDSKPSVALRLTRKAVQDTSTWLVCTAQQVALPQSEAAQIQVTLEKKDERLRVSTSKIQHANQGWAATVTLPTQCCFELPSTKSIATESAVQKVEGSIVGKLMGTTPLGEYDRNELLIEIDAGSLNALADILATWQSTNVEKQRVKTGIQGTELLNKELLIVNSRWEQLGDEHSRAHENWSSSMAELSQQLQKLGSAFQRTSRTPSQPSK